MARKREIVETVLRDSVDGVVNATTSAQLLQEYTNFGKKLREISSVAQEIEKLPHIPRVPMRLGRYGSTESPRLLGMNFFDRLNHLQSERENHLKQLIRLRAADEAKVCTFYPSIIGGRRFIDLI